MEPTAAPIALPLSTLVRSPLLNPIVKHKPSLIYTTIKLVGIGDKKRLTALSLKKREEKKKGQILYYFDLPLQVVVVVDNTTCNKRNRKLKAIRR
ncbi:unnamed protein product, partial [Dovyalis caffra]